MNKCYRHHSGNMIFSQEWPDLPWYNSEWSFKKQTIEHEGKIVCVIMPGEDHMELSRKTTEYFTKLERLEKLSQV
jgi:hypothetical protein